MSNYAALLDVDGTLVDSNDAHAHAWVKALAEHDVATSFARVRKLIGKGSDKLLPEVAGIDKNATLGKKISAARERIFRDDYLADLRAFPQARELVVRLQRDGLRIGIASSAKKDELQALLRIAAVDDLIEVSTSSDDAANSKPDPDIVQAALQRLDLPPAQVVLLGDTPYDVEAGRRAGVCVIALRCGGWADTDLAGAVMVYEDVSDLLRNYDQSPFHLLTKGSPPEADSR